MSSEREHQLQQEINRLRSEQKRADEERWKKVKEHLDLIPALKDSVDDLNASVNGTSVAPEKGFKIRLDRLEQREVERKWRQRAVETTLIGLVIKTIISMIKGS